MASDILIGILLLVSSVHDIKTHKVSRGFVIVYMIFFILFACINQDMMLAEYCGGAAIGILILIISRLSGGQIGMGDGYIFCITGLGLGFWMNLRLLMLSHVLAGVYAILLSIVRRKSHNIRFAFIPFIFISYLAMILMD